MESITKPVQTTFYLAELNPENDQDLQINKAYEELAEPQIGYDYPDSALFLNSVTAQNPIYDNITHITAINDHDYNVNEGLSRAAEMRMASDKAYAGAEQPSTDNESSIFIIGNEVCVSAEPEGVEPIEISANVCSENVCCLLLTLEIAWR